MLLWVDMIYGRTLFRTLIVHKQAYSGKISITFEPLVRFEKFKGLNWSEFNFLLIYVIFKFNRWFTRHFAAKMSIVATKSEKKSFFVIWTGAGPQRSVLCSDHQTPHQFRKSRFTIALLNNFKCYIIHSLGLQVNRFTMVTFLIFINSVCVKKCSSSPNNLVYKFTGLQLIYSTFLDFRFAGLQ